MTKSKLFVPTLITALAATLLISGPASAATINTDPVLSVDSSGAVTLTDATWTGSTSVSHQVYSCISPRATATTANPNGISGCYSLYADQNGTPITTGFDIDNAYRSLGGGLYEAYGPLSHGGNLVYASTADNVFNDTRISASDAYAREGLTTVPSLSISGSTVTGTIGVITEPNQGSLRFYACDGAFAPGSNSDAARRTVVSVSGGSSSEIPGTNTAGGGTIIAGGPTCLRILDSSPFDLTSTQTLAGFSYNPATDGTHIVAAQQLSVLSAGSGSVYYFFSDSVQYTPPAAPTISSQPALVVAQDGNLTKTNGNWSSGSLIHRVMACSSAKTASTTPGTSLPSGCTVLWSNSTNPPTQDPTALTSAFVYSGGTFAAYDPTTHGAYVLMTSTNSGVTPALSV